MVRMVLCTMILRVLTLYCLMLINLNDWIDLKTGKKLEKKISNKTAAVLIEPIQGEGGIRLTSKKDLQMIRSLTN